MKPKKSKKLRVSNPHSVEFFGQRYLENAEMQLFKYNKESYTENSSFQLEKNIKDIDRNKVNWLNVHGLHDAPLIKHTCSMTGIPRFIIQDILDPSQRPKLQDLGEYIFFTVKSILPLSDTDIDVEQISFILGQNLLLSFQERKGDHFEHVRTRIREDNGLVREKGPDFLLYLLIEGILINFYTTIEQHEHMIKQEINPLKTSSTDPHLIERIEEHKTKLQFIRRNLLASRDALHSIEKGESMLIRPDERKYFFDLKDNCLQLMENIDALMQQLDAAENLFFSLQGHRMNQVMTTLTILAAIFIPLTFMAGIYGMNFENMPELKWEYGYFSLLGLMLVIALSLVYYFRRRKWL